MPGMNQTVDGLMLMAHHAKAGTPGSFLPHAQSIEWLNFTVNGQSIGEIGIEACFAGHWDVPPIFVQGDEAACYEARMQFPDIVTTAVKRGGPDPEVCTGPDAAAARRRTALGVAEAIQAVRTRKMRPYKPALPMTVTLRLRTMDAAAKAAQKPGVLRLDDHTVEARLGRQADVIKWITGAGLDMGS
jgi:D-amino peptidase